MGRPAFLTTKQSSTMTEDDVDLAIIISSFVTAFLLTIIAYYL